MTHNDKIIRLMKDGKSRFADEVSKAIGISTPDACVLLFYMHQAGALIRVKSFANKDDSGRYRYKIKE